ncbi:MAG: hypothetical protein AB8G05_18340 [Oligoflexales bacterium]
MVIERILIIATFLSLTMSPVTILAGDVEVIHWWTSSGESKALSKLKEIMKKSGHSWKEEKIAGGGGDHNFSALKKRVVAGNPPTAVQLKGPTIQEWGAVG